MLVDLATHWKNVNLVIDAYQIAAGHLSQRGLIPRHIETYDPLLDAIVQDFRSGARDKIRLADSAIVRFERSFGEAG